MLVRFSRRASCMAGLMRQTSIPSNDAPAPCCQAGGAVCLHHAGLCAHQAHAKGTLQAQPGGPSGLAIVIRHSPAGLPSVCTMWGGTPTGHRSTVQVRFAGSNWRPAIDQARLRSFSTAMWRFASWRQCCRGDRSRTRGSWKARPTLWTSRSLRWDKARCTPGPRPRWSKEKRQRSPQEPL